MHKRMSPHGDYDHAGEAINIINNFKVDNVIFNCGNYNYLERELVKILDNKKIKYETCINNVDNLSFYANSSRFSETLDKLLSDGTSIYYLIDELPDIDKNLDKLNIRQFYMFNKPFCDDLNDERLSENYKELL